MYIKKEHYGKNNKTNEEKKKPAASVNNQNTGHSNPSKTPEFSPEKVIPIDEPTEGVMDLGNGVLMSQSEIIDFAEGTDNSVPDKKEPV
jgi:hypothetical protein